MNLGETLEEKFDDISIRMNLLISFPDPLCANRDLNYVAQ